MNKAAKDTPQMVLDKTAGISFQEKKEQAPL